ncbi:hypothetical protein AOQ84DRAFT_224003 [Glonium stellatum]|uniref:Uncharacterized protein n=1 Tax=Glonium stellatum TaxID=574774 RepID=A0A8E2JR11_9PEZI|nr:hypothetical protein AOQ84DRAFT_224003 [Glonium stellatum]
MRVLVAQGVLVTKLPFTRQFALSTDVRRPALSTAFVKMPCGGDRAAATKHENPMGHQHGACGERKGLCQLAIPLEAIPSNDEPPQRLREAGARYLCFPGSATVASKWYVACFHHLTCIALPHKSIHRNPISLAVALSRLIECFTADRPAVTQGPLGLCRFGVLPCIRICGFPAVDPAH